MATLQQLIEYSKGNPTSDIAKKTRQAIEQGLYDEEARTSGIDLSWAGRQTFAEQPVKTEEPADFQGRVNKIYKESGEKIVNKITGEGEPAPESGADEVRTTSRRGFQAAAEMFSVPGKIVHAALPEVTRTGLEELGQKVGEKVRSLSDLISKVPGLEKFVTENPEGAKALEDTLGITAAAGGIAGNILGMEGAVKTPGLVADVGKAGLGVAKEVAGEGIDLIKGGISAIKKTPRALQEAFVKVKYGENATKAINELKTAYETIPIPKNLLRAEAETGKSFADFMAEKPYIKMEVKNSKFDTWKAAQELRNEAKPEAQAMSDLLKSRQETAGFDEVEASMKEAVAKNTLGQERTAAFKYIENEMDAIKSQMGDKIIEGQNGQALMKIADWNEIKQTMWDRSPFQPTASRADRLASNIDYKMGQTIKNKIQDAVPDADIQGLNQQLGDYYHSIETLETIHGGAAPKGRLGLDFARLAGTIMGAPGGVVGSIIGYMSAEQVAKLIMSETVGQSLKRYAVQQLYTARPTVAQQVMEIIARQQGEQAARLLLPEASFIPAGPKTPNASTVESVPAPKGEPGRSPESGRFFGTFRSDTGN
mgnify:CR=1 FL=1